MARNARRRNRARPRRPIDPERSRGRHGIYDREAEPSQREQGSIVANAITLSRLLLLWLVVSLAVAAPPVWQLLNVPLLILVFASDGLDGYVARTFRQTSLFGALFDIAADRIVELSLWMLLAYLELIPLWVPLVFLTRGILVDAIRASEVENRRVEPFALLRTAVGRWLVAGRFMRGFYATLKAVAFCWWLLLLPLPELVPALWADCGGPLSAIGRGLVYLSVLVCLARGLPVIAEFVQRRETRGA